MKLTEKQKALLDMDAKECVASFPSIGFVVKRIADLQDLARQAIAFSEAREAEATALIDIAADAKRFTKQLRDRLRQGRATCDDLAFRLDVQRTERTAIEAERDALRKQLAEAERVNADFSAALEAEATAVHQGTAERSKREASSPLWPGLCDALLESPLGVRLEVDQECRIHAVAALSGVVQPTFRFDMTTVEIAAELVRWSKDDDYPEQLRMPVNADSRSAYVDHVTSDLRQWAKVAYFARAADAEARGRDGSEQQVASRLAKPIGRGNVVRAHRFHELLESARTTSAGKAIIDELLAVGEMLVAKNRAYGDSALNPVRVFARELPSDAQILVRLDDKLSRLARGNGEESEDVIADIMGYLVLLRIARKRAVGASGEAAAGGDADAGASK